MEPTKKKLVSFFLPSLQGGGAEKVTLNIIKGFLEQGHQVDLVLAQTTGPFLKDVPPNCRIVDLKAKRLAVSFPTLISYLIKEQPIALISGLNYANIIAILSVKAARVSTKAIVVVHSTLSRSIQNARGIRQKLIPFLMQLSYPKTNIVVAVSQGVADDLKNVLSLSEDKVKVIYNPVVDNELLQKADHFVQHEWFQKGSPPVIIAVGRLIKAKDYPTLLWAFGEVKREMDCRLIILGEGEERKPLEHLAEQLGVSKYLWMPGFVNNPYKYMKRAKVFVLSSRWEGLPTVLVEALACGITVISTDCPSGPREILKNGKYGRLVPVGDFSKLAQEIKEALQEETPCVSPESWKQFEINTAAKAYSELVYDL